MPLQSNTHTFTSSGKFDIVEVEEITVCVYERGAWIIIEEIIPNGVTYCVHGRSINDIKLSPCIDKKYIHGYWFTSLSEVTVKVNHSAGN